MYTSDQISRAATDLALTELIRIVIGEAFYTDDQKEFRRRMEILERAAVNGLTSRRPFDLADDSTNQRVKEEASALVTKIMTSILHPKDTGAVKS